MTDRSAKLLHITTTALAVATVGAGGFRVWGTEPLAQRLDGLTLTYIAVAAALLMLHKVKSLSFGDYKLELEELAKQVDEATAEARTASSMAQHLRGPAEAPPPAATLSGGAAPAPVSAKAWTRAPGSVTDDPWKGRFGGKCEADHRRLVACVESTKGLEGWYRVVLRVESTDAAKHPLTDRVRFFLHPTFGEHQPFVPVVKGVAELRLHAWGAFTVGVLADDGATQLELDLAENRRFPRGFRES